MADKEFLARTLEHYQQQKQAKIAELRVLDITIRQIQADLGEAPEPLVEQSIAEIKPATPQLPGSSGSSYKPRVDEFFQKSIAEAARTYLEKIGHAVLVDDILKAITSGGCKVGGADPKRTLQITLSQGKREFVATGGGNFGLRSFYNMPKLGRPEGATSKKTRAKRSTKKPVKRKAKHTAKAADPKVYDPKEVAAAINEVLSDHKARTTDEVVAAVEQRVGYPVKKIAVYSKLRKKEFEEVGEKYRLRQPAEVSQVVQ